jgi:hypothetical protein
VLTRKNILYELLRIHATDRNDRASNATHEQMVLRSTGLGENRFSATRSQRVFEPTHGPFGAASGSASIGAGLSEGDSRLSAHPQ